MSASNNYNSGLMQWSLFRQPTIIGGELAFASELSYNKVQYENIKEVQLNITVLCKMKGMKETKRELKRNVKLMA